MTAMAAVTRLRARRALSELLWCLVGIGTGAVAGVVIVGSLVPGTAVSAIRGGIVLAALLVLLIVSGASRRLGAGFRGLAERLLDEHVAAPPPLPQPGRPGRPGRRARAVARLQDGTSWRALAYLVLRLPMTVLCLYVVVFWLGAVNLTYPLWWRLFRNHRPGVRLRPLPFVTPLGIFEIRTFPGTLLVLLVGAAMLLAAAWISRGVTSIDRWLVRSLLGAGRLAERVRTLEEDRTHVLDDSAATLRRIERDLHDGTQAQLATLAMNLGAAREKLLHDADVPFDPAGALHLIDAAHSQAKEALAELRNIARGIHPPALDVGLDAALATLVARSAVPAVLSSEVPARPSQAIETIAYFSAAELLANVAEHSGARRAVVDVTAGDGRLQLTVADDGQGGASIAPEPRSGKGTGLAGLADRVRAVDGKLRIDSPPGGPTVVTVELPLRM